MRCRLFFTDLDQESEMEERSGVFDTRFTHKVPIEVIHQRTSFDGVIK